MTDMEYLSARVPRATKRRIKEIAARKNLTVQELVGRMAEEIVARENRSGPTLAEVVQRLRRAEARLKARGIVHIHVFGSVARGEAGPESDVDLLADLDEDAAPSLTGFVSLKEEIEDLLGCGVDLATRAAMKPGLLERVERDAVRVF
ncbi:MAG: nucleotidyltransferase family protein [Rhodospirillales bacterium]|nr:nucleotidyltransferase family protein [Rhodospirillales bacterium]